MEGRKMTCINCPLGCELEVRDMGDNIEVSGNRCRRGEDYGASEFTRPLRVITTSVRVENGERRVASVKTDGEVPKGLIMEIMKEIKNMSIEAPVGIADTIIENVLGTGVNIVATSNVGKRKG